MKKWFRDLDFDSNSKVGFFFQPSAFFIFP